MFVQFLGFFLVVAGCYMAGAAFNLKKNGKINRNIMLPSAIPENAITDIQGYTAYVFPKTMILAVLCVLVGAYEILLEPYMQTMLVGAVMVAVVLGTIIWYSRCMKTATEKFTRR